MEHYKERRTCSHWKFKHTYIYESFTRNIGVISIEEQAKLKHARVTVAGTSGFGGITLIQLTRMGVCSLHIIDPDE